MMSTRIQQLHQAWHEEAEAIEEDDDDRAAAECADLPDDIADVYVDAELDPDWSASVYEWDCYIFQRYLRLALERACHHGLLLPDDLRASRLLTCPVSMVRSLNFFLEHSPMHIQDYLLHYNYWLVRIERAKRSGSVDWSPVAAMAATGRVHP